MKTSVKTVQCQCGLKHTVSVEAELVRCGYCNREIRTWQTAADVRDHDNRETAA